MKLPSSTGRTTAPCPVTLQRASAKGSSTLNPFCGTAASLQKNDSGQVMSQTTYTATPTNKSKESVTVNLELPGVCCGLKQVLIFFVWLVLGRGVSV